MNIKDIILIILAVTLSNVAVFSIARNNKSSEKEQTTLNPVKYYKIKKEEKKLEEEKNRKAKILETNLKNIESYNGDSTGQEDFE